MSRCYDCEGTGMHGDHLGAVGCATCNGTGKVANERAEKAEALNRQLAAECETLRAERNRAAGDAGLGTWMWSDTEPTDLASLAEDALVTMTAGQLRATLAARDDMLASVLAGMRTCEARGVACSAIAVQYASEEHRCAEHAVGCPPRTLTHLNPEAIAAAVRHLQRSAPTSMHRGHAITKAPAGWVYADTGQLVCENRERACGHCRLPNCPDGHDACIGELPPGAVMNACCGHGHGTPWVQFWDETRIAGDEALAYIAKHKEPHV